MTSQQIAKLAGVSKTTVSRVINHDSNVKAETRAKVLKVIEAHNYVPTVSARYLAGLDSNIIGLFVMELGTLPSKTRVSKSSYFSQLVNLIIDQANNNGLQVLVSIITTEKQLAEAKTLFLGKLVYGGIFIGVHTESTGIETIMDNNNPMVIIDRHIDKGLRRENVVSINLDNYEGAYMAVSYLIASGHRKIGHITGDLSKLSGVERFKGYQDAMNHSNMKCNEAYYRIGDFQEESGYKAAKELIEETGVTAIFAANDNMAIGAIAAVKDMNFKVPEDIIVIGFDNIDIGQYLSPSLSTVHAPLDEIAKQCIRNIVYYKAHQCFETNEISLETKLILRESTLKKWQ